MNFAELEKTDVTQYIEKKGKFSYLSWPFAVSTFRKECPDGKWLIDRNEGMLPFFQFEGGAFVHIIVQAEKDSFPFSIWHPVLDNNNRPIPKPNSFQINTSIQRAIVKGIALCTGIGLHIYAGEDLPPGDEKKEEEKKDTPKHVPVTVADVQKIFGGKWTREQNAAILTAADGLGMTTEDRIAFKKWAVKTYGVTTWDGMPDKQDIATNFDKYYDSWKLG